MRTLILLLSFFFFPVKAVLAQQIGDKLFDTSFIHEVRIESPANNFFDLLLNAWSGNIEGNVYLPAAVRIDGVLIDSVGVRIKGSLSAFSNKRPLKIDFNKYVGGQEIDGIKKLNLNNGYLDPAMQREVLGFHMFRQAGIRAPRTAYTKVYINNGYHGIYIMIEQVDKTFLHDLFADNAGTLYANKTCDYEVDSGEDTLGYYTEMMTITNTLSGAAFVAALDQVLDTDAFLRFFLIENFINAKDNPIDLGCNHYLYHELGSGLLHWIPWDLNFAFYNGNPYPLLYSSSHDVVYKKMLQNPVYRQRYLTLACEMLDYLFVSTSLNDFIDRHAQQIRSEIASDPRYLSTITEFESDVQNIKNLMASRRQTFLDGLMAATFVCPQFESPVPFMGLSINELVASSDSSSGIPDPSGSFPDWIELHNNTSNTISLKGFYLSNDRDFQKKWAFPANASIPPNGYLVVWADRDINEPGLHCNFKLDKSGGALFLTHENLTSVDSMYYGEQATNVAFARVPNGFGQFMAQAPTFGQNNAPQSGTANAVFPSVFNVFPNPAVGTVQVETGSTGLETHFTIINLLGQILETKESDTGHCTFNVQNLASGLYFIAVAQGEKQLVRAVQVGRY